MGEAPLPLSICRVCGETLDDATFPEDIAVMPAPGDVSLCFMCGVASVFDDNLVLRPPTQEEEQAINNTPEVVQYRQYILDMRRRRNNP